MKQSTGSLTWFDIPTHNEAKSIPFYEEVLGWNFTTMNSTYWIIKVDGDFIGAIRKDLPDQAKSQNSFMPYFAVASVNESNLIIEKCGGKLVGEVIPITDGVDGYFQKFQDLDGNLLSLWSKKP
jgi:predicted enzyme related to lactoylglutathione lyase